MERKSSQKEKVQKRSQAGRTKKAGAESNHDVFKSLFENNSMPMWTYDPNTLQFLTVNESALELYGYTQNEFSKFTLDRIRNSSVQSGKEVAGTDDRISSIRQEVHTTKNGKKVEVEITASRLTIGEQPIIAETIRDITPARKKEQLQRILYGISKAADATTGLSEVYRTVHELVREIMVAENFYIALYSQHDKQVRYPYYVDTKNEQSPSKGFWKDLENYVLQTQTSLLCTKSGYDTLVQEKKIPGNPLETTVWLGVPLIVQKMPIGVLVLHDYSNESAYTPVEQEVLQYVASQVANAIERRLAVFAIKEHESNLSALIENTEDAIWSLDASYSLVTYNSAARNLFKKMYSLDLREGLSLIELFPEEIKQDWQKHCKRAMEGGRFTIGQQFAVENELLEFEVAFNPIFNEDNSVYGISIFAKDISVRKRNEELQRKRNEAILRHQKALTALAKTEYRSLDQALNVIAKVASETLNVAQVTIWIFSEDRKGAVCEASFHLNSPSSLVGYKILSSDYPEYFSALESSHAVIASNALTDPITTKLAENYLKPFGIGSMMDVPVHLHGKVVGIVCHEHSGIDRAWSLDEQEFAVSIADCVSIALETARRKSIEVALHDSEERYRTYLSQTSEATWCYEVKEPVSISLPIDEQIHHFYKHTYLAECNDAMAKMYGYESAERLIGSKLEETLVPSEPQNIEMLRQFIASGYRLTDIETSEVDKDGNPKYFLNNLLGIVKDGYVYRAWGTQRDITERKRVENELIRLAHAVRSISESVCITDFDNNIIFVNNAFVRTYGIEEHAIRGVNFGDFLRSTNTLETVNEIFTKTFQGGWQGEIISRRANGELFTSHLSTSLIKDEVGKSIALIAISSDIQERKAAEQAVRESELRFRILAETVAAAIIIYQGENFIYANPAAEELLGYSKNKLQHMKFWEVVHPDFREMIRSRGVARQRGESVPSRYEFKVISRQGEERWIDFAGAVINYEGSQAVLGTAFDITERKRVEHLQTAVYRIAQAAEGATDLGELFQAVHAIIGEVMPARNFYIALYDDQSDIVSFPYFVDEEDTPPEARKSRRGLTEYVIRSGRSLLSNLAVHEELATTGEIESIGSMSPIWLGVPLIIGKKTIGVMTVQHYSDPRAYGEREQQMLEFVSTQVAKAIERKRTEDLLRTNEKRYRALIENSSDVVVLVSKEGQIVYESQAIKRVLGYSQEERIGQDAFSLVHPEDITLAGILFESVTSKPDKVVSSELRIKHADGSWRWLEVVGKNLLNDPNIHAIVANYRDITERKESEEALRDSEERFRSLFESATDAIFTLSLSGIITSLNPAFEKITGWKCNEWIGRSITTIISDEDIALASRALKETLKGKQPPAYELKIHTKSGEYIVGEFTTTPQIQNNKIIGVLGIARDITERKKLEDQIRYIQKMESIGILAGGVAHDFNNILAIINAYAGSLKMMTGQKEQYAHNIGIIEKTVQRGARIVQQLLTLAKKSEPIFSDITICPIIDELSKLLHETFPKTITFDINVPECNVIIAADSNQLYQVLLNLCLNARDAMPAGGKLSIRSSIMSHDEVMAHFPEAAEEKYLTLTISDSGTGMDDETKKHIFEPFFTTKEKGKGTGLGLSVVYGIVQNHKGFIEVETAAGEGTRFVIYLPLPHKGTYDSQNEAKDNPENIGGKETLLLVEDEINLLDLLAEVLNSYGYTILTAADGEEAVRVFRENKDIIRLVLSDLGLPKLGGFEAFQQMKKINPRIKVILASGYKDKKVYDDMLQSGAEDFIQKPYNVSDVIKRIRDILDSE